MGKPAGSSGLRLGFHDGRLLTDQEAFDHYVVVAPEGRVYGYFFEQLRVPVLSVCVDYPPRRCAVLDEFAYKPIQLANRI